MNLWRELPPVPPTAQFHIPNPRGLSHSKIIMLTPIPDQQEYANKTPFSNETAHIFHQILKEEGLPTDRVFVVPCVRWGVKALTANTREITVFVKSALKSDIFNFVISVGEDATRWIVNGGKKANMGTFAGQLVYPPNLFHKPLYVFSDPKGLVPEMTQDNRENYFRRKFADDLRKRIQRQAEKLARILNTRKAH